MSLRRLHRSISAIQTDGIYDRLYTGLTLEPALSANMTKIEARLSQLSFWLRDTCSVPKGTSEYACSGPMRLAGTNFPGFYMEEEFLCLREFWRL